MSSITAIILAALVVGVVGIIVGFLLVTAGEKFKVEVQNCQVTTVEAVASQAVTGWQLQLRRAKHRRISVRWAERL